MNVSSHVVVIGAGPVGLAAAAQLVRRDIDYTLLEAGDRVGASMREWGHVHRMGRTTCRRSPHRGADRRVGRLTLDCLGRALGVADHASSTEIAEQLRRRSNTTPARRRPA